MSTVFRSLLEVLEKIDRPGSFCVSGSVPPILPGLEVEQMGSVGLPLGAMQASELASHCHRAAYGKGEKTIVDESVRCVLELDSDRFSLMNPRWAESLEQIVETVRAELGLGEQKLECHPYKLLLYEPDSFFLPHRDGEKIDRMVATLVITLPSFHEGGELIVRHDGEEQVLDFGGPQSPYQTNFAAFYADCQHEIRPLRRGHRLSLVYNLTLARSSRSKRGITAPRRDPHVSAVERILRRWREDGEPEKLVVTLDHQYSQKGLTAADLKGVDRVKAQVLFKAALREECRAYLVLLTLWESGVADDSGTAQGRYGHRSYYDEDDDGGDYTMVEVYETGLTTKHWCDPDGNPRSFGEMGVDEDTELVSARSLRDVAPEEEFEGYTGNAGMTLDRWYHHAAIVLWPEERHFDILCNVGTAQAVSGLAQMVDAWRRLESPTRDASRSRCLAFAEKIISRWRARPYARSEPADGANTNLLPLLDALNDYELVRRFLREVLPIDSSQDPGGTLPSLCKRYGWQRFHDELTHIIDATTNETVERNARLVEDLCLLKDSNTARRELCRVLAERMLAALERWDAQRKGGDWQSRTVDRPALLLRLVRSLVALEEATLFERLVDHVLGLAKMYPLTSVQIPALTSLCPWLKRNVKASPPALARWLDSCCKRLESRTSQVPQRPADWRRAAKLSCDCADCSELARFLGDSNEQVHGFRVRKDRRQHLHQIIDRHQCDVEHVTDRRGSPQTLVCTKNIASFQRALKAHKLDLEHLTKMRNMQAELGTAGARG